MEEDDRKVKEYYQVSLDTGRIFWIAFLLGLVLIGVLVLGFYVGGGKVKKGTLSFDKTLLMNKEKVEAEEQLPPLDLFENELSAETKRLEEKSPADIEKASETAELFEQQVVFPEAAEKAVRVPVPAVKEIGRHRVPYIPKGDYYIQVASFTKEENAKNLAEELGRKLYRVSIEEAKVGEQLFYRVRVGPFETKGVANNTMTSMKRRFDLKDPFVLKKNS